MRLKPLAADVVKGLLPKTEAQLAVGAPWLTTVGVLVSDWRGMVIRRRAELLRRLEWNIDRTDHHSHATNRTSASTSATSSR